ncbi:MAG: GNAT family acetyltransferase [Lachnospiraceae bacterium]|nr:GNAT family acetyltransferase [Lachnospiraceae bacterium]
MLDKTKFMALHYYDYGDPFTGSYRGMRYRLEKIKGEAEGESLLKGTVWPDPYNFVKTPEDKKISQTFPFSEEGKDQAVDWFEQMRKEHHDIYDTTPNILDVEPIKQGF